MPRHFAAIATPLALLLALTACSQTEDKLLDLQLSQSVQDRFNQPASVFTAGETVAVVAALRNPNSKAVRVQFGGCQLFRTEIKSAAGEFRARFTS